MDLKYIVLDDTNLKRILREKLSISQRLYNKIIHNYVLVNGSRIEYNTVLSKGDIITISFDYEEDNSNIVPNDKLELNILYEDEWMLIVDKPAGIPVHPSLNHYEDSLSNAVRSYYDKIGLHKEIRPVNRLDKDTSGVVIFAKCEYIQENLKDYNKEYLAIACGKLDGSGTINKPIARKNESIIERCIDEKNGDIAITHYEVVKHFYIDGDGFTLVRCILETGRTHQIRVHLSSIGHPLLGDTLYGVPSDFISRQALHASKISFIHPVTRKNIDIISNIPVDMKKIIK